MWNFMFRLFPQKPDLDDASGPTWLAGLRLMALRRDDDVRVYGGKARAHRCVGGGDSAGQCFYVLRHMCSRLSQFEIGIIAERQ